MSRLRWKLVCQRRQHLLRSSDLSTPLVLKCARDALALRPHVVVPRNASGACCFPHCRVIRPLIFARFIRDEWFILRG